MCLAFVELVDLAVNLGDLFGIDGFIEFGLLAVLLLLFNVINVFNDGRKLLDYVFNGIL